MYAIRSYYGSTGWSGGGSPPELAGLGAREPIEARGPDRGLVEVDVVAAAAGGSEVHQIANLPRARDAVVLAVRHVDERLHDAPAGGAAEDP